MQNSLRVIRKRKGLTAEALGKMCGYNFRTVSQYENADDPLPREFLRKVSEALHVAPSEIETPPPQTLREEENGYRASDPMLPMNVMPLDTLKYISDALSEKMNQEKDPAKRGEMAGVVVTLSRVISAREASLKADQEADQDARNLAGDAERQAHLEETRQKNHEERGRKPQGDPRPRGGGGDSNPPRGAKAADHKKY